MVLKRASLVNMHSALRQCSATHSCIPASITTNSSCSRLRLSILLNTLAVAQVFAGQHLVLETSQVMSQIPYADHFRWAGLGAPALLESK